MDTFLTILYVMAEDFCKIFLPPEPHPGPSAALSRSEVVTLALCGQWQDCGSERGLYRYAQHHLRAALPSLSAREQYNRQVRRQHAALVAFFRISSIIGGDEITCLAGLPGAAKAGIMALDPCNFPVLEPRATCLKTLT